MKLAGVETVNLNDEDVSILRELSQSFPDCLGIGQENGVVDWVENKLEEVQDDLTQGLANVSAAFTSGATTALHLTGLSHDHIPPTPLEYETVDHATVYPFDIPHLALSGLVGTVYGSRHVRGGRILADIFPKPTFDDRSDSAFGSQYEFDFHADGIVQPDTAPDVFALHCIKNTEQVPTYISTISQDDLSPELFEVLREPAYTIRYEVGNDDDILEYAPVIEVASDGGLHLNYYGEAKIRPIQSIADQDAYVRALEAFKRALIANAQSIILQPGEILLVDNKRSLHGRRAFDSQSVLTEDRRWLRRVFIATDPHLQSKIAASDDRVLISQYKK